MENFPLDKYIVTLDHQNDTNEVMYVTTEMFEIINIDTKLPMKKSERDKIFPSNDITKYYIDFCRLNPKLADNLEGEHIKFTATMEIANGTKTFNTSSIASYGYTMDAPLAASAWEVHLTSLKSKNPSITPDDIENEKQNWYLLEAYRHYIPDSFDYIIETVGVFSNQVLVKTACDVLISKLLTLKDLVESNTIDISTSSSTMVNCFDVVLPNENHTIGNMLSYIINLNHLSTITYNGFRKQHPHDTHSILRLAVIPDVEGDKHISEILTSSIDVLVDTIQHINNQFV
jgi:DNA-directed RNA polymerase subunit L